MKLFIKLKYCGTAYSGYQVQSNAKTIQAELNRALYDLFGFECDLTGCSRTDAGVHALCFCATVTRHGVLDFDSRISANKIPFALNVRLPSDISVFHASFVENDFHPRYSVKEKTYVYRILNAPHRDPFEENKSFHYPISITNEQLKEMQAAANLIRGTHDFSAFMASGSNVKDTVRTVSNCNISRIGDIIEIKISADGFLYNMVRIICGTLIDVSKGVISAKSITNIIESKDRTRAGSTLPACGLYLTDVKY